MLRLRAGYIHSNLTAKESALLLQFLDPTQPFIAFLLDNSSEMASLTFDINVLALPVPCDLN